MKKTKNILPMLLASVLCGLVVPTPTARAQGTGFTYQGRLNVGANPANGTYDLRFRLGDTDTGGNQWGPALTNNAVTVSNGLFTTTLDFGFGVFTGGPRWLQIGVRTNGGGVFEFLSPRTAVLPTPYAIYAANAAQAQTVSGTVPASGLIGLYSNPVNFNSPANSFAGNGAGLTSVNAATLNGLTSGGFWKTNGNTGANPANGAFLGTTDNQPLEFRVANSPAFRLEPDPRGINAANIIGGYISNRIEQPGTGGSVIVGGGYPGGENIIRSNSSGVFIGAGSANVVGPNARDAVISGGIGNTVQPGAIYASIGGGFLNTIQSNAFSATIAGGEQNTIQSNAAFATIGGGQFNRIETVADRSTIGGGGNNTIVGSLTLPVYGTIAGGAANTIQTNTSYSTIGGGRLNLVQSINFSPTIAGGEKNGIYVNASFSAIGGGLLNSSASEYATIGGGQQNIIQTNAHYATIPGGFHNNAAGVYSFAAGRQAKANHQGAFVWADSQDADFASTGSNQFLIRAAGGVGIGTNNPNGAALAVNGIVTATSFSGNGAGLANVNADTLGGVSGSTFWKIGGNAVGAVPGRHKGGAGQ